MKNPLLAILATVLPAFCFSLEVDSIYTPQYYDHFYDTSVTIFRNSSIDTVVIDSMRTRETEALPEWYELWYTMDMAGDENYPYLGGYRFEKLNSEISYDGKDSVSVPPGAEISITVSCLDVCCVCRVLAKRSAQGDPMILNLLFFSGQEIDTCTILSRVHTVSARPVKKPKFSPPADIHRASEAYTIHGQRLPANQPHTGIKLIKVNGRFQRKIYLRK